MRLKEPHAKCMRIWQHEEYQEKCFANELAQLIFHCGVEIVDKEKSDSILYQQFIAKVQIKKDNWELQSFLLEHLVKNLSFTLKNKT